LFKFKLDSAVVALVISLVKSSDTPCMSPSNVVVSNTPDSASQPSSVHTTLVPTGYSIPFKVNIVDILYTSPMVFSVGKNSNIEDPFTLYVPDTF